MATTVNKTVKSAGGDYTTLTAWEAANQGDLVAADEVRQAECFALAETSTVTIDGSTTDATRYLRVYASAGLEAQMPFSSSVYRLQVAGNALVLGDDYCRVERIQVDTSNSSTVRAAIRVNNKGCFVLGCLVRNTHASNANHGVHCLPPANEKTIVANCVAIGNGVTGGHGFNADGGGANAAVYFYNCTAIGWANGVMRTGRDCHVKNCLSHGNSGSDFSGTFTSISYCASEDATASGTGSRASQTFTFVNAAGGDYHLASGDAGAKNFGTDLSADAIYPFSTDFDGATRTGTWDIGADEFVTSDINLIVQDMLIALAIESPALVQANVLAIDDLSVALAIDNLVLTQANVLSLDDLLVALGIETPALTQQNVLAIQDALVALSIDNVELVVEGALVVQGTLVALEIDNVDLIQQHALQVADMQVAVLFETPTLEVGGFLLQVADALVALGIENVALIQQHVLDVQNAHVALTIDGVALLLPRRQIDIVWRSGPLVHVVTLSGALISATQLSRPNIDSRRA